MHQFCQVVMLNSNPLKGPLNHLTFFAGVVNLLDMRINISDKLIVNACLSSLSMAQAASKLGIHFNTLHKHAKRLGVYKPNQSGKGIRKKSSRKIPLREILLGKHPQYQTYKLKIRLIHAGIKKNECEECGMSKWMGKKLEIELEHIDGIRTNHLLKNLKMLCPNCHSITSTFRGKNKRKCC